MGDSFYVIKKMVANYAKGGFLLIAVTVIALLLANSSFSGAYFSWWQMPIELSVGGFNLFSHGGEAMTLQQFINDALMAIFFFSVGLEIKREVLVGELSSFRKALLPIIGACGGMIVPILVFRMVAQDENMLLGSAIPMATDIAFSLGVLAMLGKRVPVGLKIFLATLAVVDDIGGILVIAIFYSGHMALQYLLYSAVLILIILWGARRGINNNFFYSILGIAVWSMFLHSGVHSTIAGVLVAFCIPARPVLDTHKFIERIRKNIAKFPDTTDKDCVSILTNEQIDILKSVESDSDRVISPLQNMEDSLHPLVNYFVIPLFAFANAGVSLEGMELPQLFEGVSLAVLLGLILGKFVGIFSFSYIAVKTKLVDMPKNANWSMMAGVSLLGGIGFTVSLFIADLSYSKIPVIGATLLGQAKLGIIMGSAIAGVLGYVVLKTVLPKGIATTSSEDAPSSH